MDTITRMRWIYLSPHLDDAALSAGGLIFDQTRMGLPVEIWTLMSGVPEGEKLSAFAVEMHTKWHTTHVAETVQLRREEDQRAAVILGVKPAYFDFPDALYRRDAVGDALYGDPVGAPRHPEDTGLPAKLADAMRGSLCTDDILICPLGIGDHVDHLLVREAAEMLGRQLHFIADIPYVLTHPEAVFQKVGNLGLAIHPVSEDGLDAWIESVAAYRSQLDSLYESWDLLQEGIWQRCLKDGGIRIWSTFPSGLDSGPNP